jgi:hypothetical protein
MDKSISTMRLLLVAISLGFASGFALVLANQGTTPALAIAQPAE